MRACYLRGFGGGLANTPIAFVSTLMLTLVTSFVCVAVMLAERRVLHYMAALARATFQ